MAFSFIIISIGYIETKAVPSNMESVIDQAGSTGSLRLYRSFL